MLHLHFSHLTLRVLLPSNEVALKSTQINTDTLVTVVCLISCLRERLCDCKANAREIFFYIS